MLRIGLCLLGSVALVACGDHTPAPTDVALTSPVRILASEPVAASQVVLQLPGVDAGQASITIPVKVLHLGIHTGATPAIDELMIPLGDLDIPATTLPPSGLSLRNMILSIPQSLPVAVESSADVAVEMRAATQLRLNWAQQLPDGTVTPLVPVPTEPLELDIQVLRENGVVTTIISAGSHLYIESPASADAL